MTHIYNAFANIDYTLILFDILRECMIVRILIIFSLIQSINAEEYNFVAISGLYEQEVGEVILTSIYQKIGLDIKISRMPGQRAIMEATKGRVDGEVMRIWSYGDEYSEMIRIPTSYYFLETMAFFKDGSGVEVFSLEDLVKYSVLKVRGVKHTNMVTEKLINVYDFDDTKTMFDVLSKGRNQVALTHKGDGLFAIKKYRMKDIKPSLNSLSLFPLYHYVHKKNAHLVDKIDRIIINMKENGELDKLIRRAEQQVFESNGMPYQKAD